MTPGSILNNGATYIDSATDPNYGNRYVLAHYHGSLPWVTWLKAFDGKRTEYMHGRYFRTLAEAVANLAERAQ